MDFFLRRFSTFYSQCTWSELSGALGDLGTFIPLLVGLVRQVGLDLGTTLIATGLYNVLTGLQFGIPMPVQPMKTISAVALSEESLTIPEMVSAGLTVSCVVFILGITRGMTLFNHLVPFSLVRGIQLGVGLRLAIRGLKMVFYLPGSAQWRSFSGPDGLILGLFGLAFILLTTLPPRVESANDVTGHGVRMWVLEWKKRWKADEVETERLEERTVSCRKPYRIPSALLLVILGIILLFSYDPQLFSSLKFGPSTPQTVIPTWQDFKEGLWRAGLPQLPLTTLNSVVAVCKLSEELFPELPADPRDVAVSVGAMNIAGAWFGVMPCCHGAGGLAAQAKFGAKTGTAPVLLGLIKIILGLCFGSSLFRLLYQFPAPLLGSMLVFSGIELAACCRSEKDLRGICLMLMTAAGNFATGNTGIGFLIGTSAYILVSLFDVLQDLIL